MPNYVTYQNGFADVTEHDRSYYFKIGKIVTVVVNAIGDVSTSTTIIFNLPAGYRPISNVKTNYTRDGYAMSGTLTADIAGNIRVHNTTAYNGSVCGLLTFLTA